MGVRRPLRFLVEQLSLDEAQIFEVSRALDALRLEREQVILDRKRARSQIADLVQADTLDDAALTAAGQSRIDGAGREKVAIEQLVRTLHGLLSPDQRRQLATLMRTGPLVL